MKNKNKNKEENKYNILLIKNFRKNKGNLKIRQDTIEYFYLKYKKLLAYNNKFRNNEELDLLITESIIEMLNTYSVKKGTLVKSYLKTLFFYRTQNKQFIEYENFTDEYVYENIPNEKDEYKEYATREVLKDVVIFLNKEKYGNYLIEYVKGVTLKELGKKFHCSHTKIWLEICEIRKKLKEKFNYIY